MSSPVDALFTIFNFTVETLFTISGSTAETLLIILNYMIQKSCLNSNIRQK